MNKHTTCHVDLAQQHTQQQAGYSRKRDEYVLADVPQGTFPRISKRKPIEHW